MKKILRLASCLLLLSILAACTSFPYSNTPPTKTATPEIENISTPETAATEIPAPEESGPKTLRVWLQLTLLLYYSHAIKRYNIRVRHVRRCAKT